jgi:hypothetical protein
MGFKSNAEWPMDIYNGHEHNITSDTHDTHEKAQAICRALKRDGFAGERRQFPIRTWVSELWIPSNGSDGCNFLSNCADKCSKEKRCKYIKNSLIGEPFELMDGVCIHLKPIGTKNKPRKQNQDQLNMFDEI